MCTCWFVIEVNTCIYIYIYVCVCVCVCVRARACVNVRLLVCHISKQHSLISGHGTYKVSRDVLRELNYVYRYRECVNSPPPPKKKKKEQEDNF